MQKKLGTIHKNRTANGSNSNIRPDIVISNNTIKQITIIDVPISFPFETRYESFRKARSEKMKMKNLDALIVETLGCWDPANELVLRNCNINRNFAGCGHHFIFFVEVTCSVYIQYKLVAKYFNLLKCMAVDSCQEQISQSIESQLILVFYYYLSQYNLLRVLLLQVVRNCSSHTMH